MDEIDNKFIMMARLAVMYRKEGLDSHITISPLGACRMCVFIWSYDNDDAEMVESIGDHEVTEQELLQVMEQMAEE